MTANDEPTVAALRRMAAAHAPDDSWRPEVTVVLRRGRMLRARRSTGAATAGALVLALAIGVPATFAGRGSLGLAQPTVTTPATMRQLANGVWAATGVSDEVVGRDAVGNPTDWTYQLGSVDDIAVSLHVTSTGAGRFAAYGTQGSEVSTGTGSPLSAQFPEAATTFPKASTGVFLAGVTPPGANHAFLVSSAPLDDAFAQTVIELPTFAPPRYAAGFYDSDQAMYVVAVTPPAATRLLMVHSRVVFTTAEGAIVDPQCPASACLQNDLPAAYDELQVILAKFADAALHGPTPGETQTTPARTARPSSAADQKPVSVGTDAVSTLAPGLVALNVPTGSTTPSTVTDFAGWRVRLARATSTDAGFAGMSVTIDAADQSAWTNSVAWPAEGGPSDIASWSGLTMGTDSHGVLFGAVPSWLPDPVAVLISGSGWVGSDGTIHHIAELPTFRAPTPDGRLVYLLGASGDAAVRVLGEPSYDVAFIGSDREVVMPSCGQDTLDTCSALRHQPLAGWVSVAAGRYGAPAAETAANPFLAAEGLFQDPENPGSGANILARSLWVGTLDGVQLLVYTGFAGAENTADGEVWVIVNDPVSSGTHGWQDTRAGTGALRISAVDRDVLTLVDDHGGTHRFDVGDSRWLS